MKLELLLKKKKIDYMCYFMGQRVSRDNLVRLKNIEKELGTKAALEAMCDGFRYKNIAVIVPAGKNDFDVQEMHWEFIPFWMKDIEAVKLARKQGIPWFNAKGETLLTSKMFRDAALKRRCLLPLSYFFEYRSYQPELEKKPSSYPYEIKVKNQDYFFVAGIWQTWVDKSTGEMMPTCALVTTEANELMRQIHNKKNRMPTILPEELAYRWIYDDLSEPEITELATHQVDSSLLQAHTVDPKYKIMEDPTTHYQFVGLPELVY